MAKKLNISSIFKKRETGSSSSSAAAAASTTTWQWPSCTHSKTISFRADDNIFKTMNSIFSDPFDGIETPKSNSSTSEDQSSVISISTHEETFENEPSLELIIKGVVKSERLFFEPGNNTSSILQNQKQEQEDEENEVEEELPFKESIILAMESKNPYWDFKKSMKEMVESEGIKDWENLQELLTWYLKMNGKINHRFILSAFIDLIVEFANTTTNSVNTPSSISDSITSYNSSSSFSCPSSPLSFLGHNNKEIEEQEN